MVNVPENKVTLSDIEQWKKLSSELKALKASEMLLRKKIFNGIFTNPIEGTMKVPLDDKTNLIGVYVIDRSIDQAVLSNTVRFLHEQSIPVDSLITYKPSLVIAEYRKLTEQQRLLFDHILVIKPSSPTLKIEEVKVKK